MTGRSRGTATLSPAQQRAFEDALRGCRGQTIRFTYMTNFVSDTPPGIFLSCQKAGVRVKYKQPYQPIGHLWGTAY